jgi:ketosteroid isomerase-like protein
MDTRSEPIDLVRRWLEAFNERDVSGLLAVAHPDIVVRPIRLGGRRQYRGMTASAT